MKFRIYQPKAPTDPRSLIFGSIADVDVAFGDPLVRLTEAEAMRTVRSCVPDAVAMPVPIKLGSGKSLLLGFVEDASKPVDPEHQIPFVLFVMPVSETEMDRRALSVGGAAVYDRKLWALAPVRPQIAAVVDVEIRSTELEVPAFATARIGADHRGLSTVFVEVGDNRISITLRDEIISLGKPVADHIEGSALVAIFNGVPKLLPRDKTSITYDEIVELAESGRTGLHSVMFGTRGGRSGTVIPGGSVPLQPGMVFNAFVTDGA